MSKVSIIIAERSYIIRKGLEILVKSFDQVEITASVSRMHDLKQHMRNSSWDYLFLGSTFVRKIEDFCESIQETKCQTNVILLRRDDVRVREHLFRDVVSLDEEKHELLSRLEGLFLHHESEPTKEDRSPGLSDREKKIVELVARGYTNKHIAEELYLSLHTVITHRKNISLKLGINSISGLTIYAILNDLVQIQDMKEYKNP